MPDQFIVAEENIQSVLIELLIDIKANQIAANEIFAGKLSKTNEEAVELFQVIKRVAHARSIEIFHEIYEKYGTVNLNDILPDNSKIKP